MKEKATTIYRILAIVCVLGLTGCERTLEDISTWESKGQTAKLIKALGDDNTKVCTAAATALGKMKAESAVAPLAGLFTHANPKVAVAAVESLAAIGGKSAEQQLITAINHNDLRVCLAAISGLGTTQAVSAIDPLSKMLDAIDDEIACAAATALGQMNDAAAVKPLTDKVQTRAQSLRLACVRSLGSIGGPESTEGLVLALGDISKNVRQEAIHALVTTGKSAAPHALTTLRREEANARQSAITILKAIDAVPTEGHDFVWYQLAEIPASQKVRINAELVNQLAGIGTDAIDALLEGVAHEDLNIREHAFRALERIGEPCLLKAMEAVDAHATSAAQQWYASRPSWAGSPAWQNDLWGAATALSPHFEPIGRINEDLLIRLLADRKTQLRRKYIPLLISLNTDADNSKIDLFGADASGFNGTAYRNDAMLRLATAGDRAVLPLIAALEDSDTQVTDSCAEVLGNIGDERAMLPLAEALLRKVDQGEELTLSPFYTALQQFDGPAADAALCKVRPDTAYANRIFAQAYPDARLTNTRTKNARAAYTQPIGFKVVYRVDGTAGELLITFVKDDAGDWLPTPPMPAKLP